MDDLSLDDFGFETIESKINKPFIYLASPYRLIEDKEELWRRVNFVSASLLCAGNILYSPISMTHGIDKYIPHDTDFSFYRELDMFYLHRCDILAVITIPGWKESVGVQAEIQEASNLGKPVLFLPDPVISTGKV